jgi:hypothetical protein
MRMSAHFWNSSKPVTKVLVLTTSAQVAPAALTPDLQRDRLVGIEPRLYEDQIGQFRLAVIDGIAECTPNLRAS